MRIDTPVSKIEEYVRKFGSASRFVQKLIDSFDYPFAIVNAITHEVEVTNGKEFFPGMKCNALFKRSEEFCSSDKCSLRNVFVSKRAVVVKECYSENGSLEIHGHPIFDAEGEVASVIIYGLDISQNEAMRESEEKFRSLFDEAEDAILVADPETNTLTDCNDSTVKLTGYTKSQLIGMSLVELMPEEEMDRSLEMLARHASGEKVFFETKILKRDGITRVPVSINASVIEIRGKSYLQGIFRDITERKKAEDDLKGVEVLLKSSIEASKDLIMFSIDKNYNYLYFNEAHRAGMFATYNKEVEVGMNLLECMTNEDDIERAKVNYDRALAGESHAEIDEYGDLGRSYYETTYSPIFNGKNEVVGVTAFARDITARKRSEEELRESEGRFRALSDVSFDGIGVICGGKIIEMNEGFLNAIGYEMKELVGKDVGFLVVPEDRENVMKHIKEGHDEPYEHRMTRKDGIVIDVEVSGKSAFYKGKDCRVTAIRDITERKRAERELRESEEKFKRLSESSPFGIFYTDASGSVLYTNPIWQEITGLTLEEGLGFEWINALHPEDKPRVLRDWETCLKKKVNYAGEFRFVDTSGDVKWVYTTTTPLKSVDGKITGHVGANEDITERKRAEKELEDLAKFPSENLNPVLRVKKDKTILYANAAAKSVLEEKGLNVGDTIAKRWYELIDESFVSGNVIRDIEMKLKDGIFSWMLVPIEGKDYLNIYGVDITEKKKIETKLKEKEQVYVKEIEDRFYNILQNSQDLVYRHNFKENSFDYVSESVFTILGYSLGEFMKMKKSDYNKRIHPDDVGVVDDMGDVAEEESASVVEYRFKKKDGEYIWLKVQRVFFRDKDGGLLYSIEDLKDITLEKSVSEERAKLEERVVYMRNKATETKERVSLTDREKLVLWGFCRYPLLNDEELAVKLDLKRSTLTAIKNRLKGKNWFSISYVPNFHKLGCQFFSVFDANLKYEKARRLETVKNELGVVLNNCQDDKSLGVFVSDKYVDFKRFLEDFAGTDVRYGLNEDSFFYDLDSVELFDVSGLVNSSFGLKRREKAVVYKFENDGGDLNTNEKRVLDAMIKNPEMSSSDVAKKIWTSKPTVIKVKKKLLDEGFVYPYVVPDFRKMGFSYIARLSFTFDSDSFDDDVKGFSEAGVLLKVKGKRKMMKIILFASEDEYVEEVSLLKDLYHKKGVAFKLNSDIFPMQKRRFGNSKMENFVNDRLFGDEL